MTAALAEKAPQTQSYGNNGRKPPVVRISLGGKERE